MELIFLEDVGRYKKGDVRDYPKSTWEGIEKSVGRKLSKFTSPLQDFARATVLAKDKSPKNNVVAEGSEDGKA